ncbi:MAG: hypothetical protein H7Z18_02575 [Methylophilaceae bacterium]|nr:hypothetical protein [Methylophilaceae bacterium]
MLQIAGSLRNFGGWSFNLIDSKLIWSDEVAAIHDMPPSVNVSIEQALRVFNARSRVKIENFFSVCINNGMPHESEFEIITAKNREIWVRCIGRAVKNSDDEIVRI